MSNQRLRCDLLEAHINDMTVEGQAQKAVF